MNITQVTKSYYQDTVYKYVPFFIVCDIFDNKLDSIQTSSESVLKEFFEKNDIKVNILTDDF